MKERFYLLCLEGGTDLQKLGPFDTYQERDQVAKNVWKEMNSDRGDNIFWSDLRSDGELEVGPYVEGDLE